LPSICCDFGPARGPKQQRRRVFLVRTIATRSLPPPAARRRHACFITIDIRHPAVFALEGSLFSDGLALAALVAWKSQPIHNGVTHA